MIFQQILSGGGRNFGYLIGDEETGEAAVIDPSSFPEKLIQAAEKYELKIIYVIGTHAHGDHTGGIPTIKKETGAKVVMHASAPGNADINVEDGDMLRLNRIRPNQSGGYPYSRPHSRRHLYTGG